MKSTLESNKLHDSGSDTDAELFSILFFAFFIRVQKVTCLRKNAFPRCCVSSRTFCFPSKALQELQCLNAVVFPAAVFECCCHIRTIAVITN